MKEKYRILVINPGSTSTKVSLFENETSVFEHSLFHEASTLLAFPHVNDQLPFRRDVILDMLKSEGVDPASIDAFVGRGGGACSQPGGITSVDQRMYDDTKIGMDGSQHPAKLGVMLAWTFAKEYGKPAFTLNPTNVDEFCDYARLTGIKGVYRFPHSHVLNQKAVAEFHAGKLGRRYEDCNFVVAHIDGGITVSAHDHGRMVDGSMGADGEGAFTPTRIGSVPVLQLLDYIESHSVADVRLRCWRAGGFVDLFGTYSAYRYCRVGDDGKPAAIDSLYDCQGNQRILRAKSDVQVQVLDTPGGSVTGDGTVSAGTYLYFQRTDGSSFVDFMTSEGQAVRIKTDTKDTPHTTNGTDESELFDGLMYAG